LFRILSKDWLFYWCWALCFCNTLFVSCITVSHTVVHADNRGRGKLRKYINEFRKVYSFTEPEIRGSNIFMYEVNLKKYNLGII
jgi:hypothetical protein